MLKFLLILSFSFFTFCSNAQSDEYHQSISMGDNAVKSRQYNQAIQYYNQAIKLAPQSPEPYLKQMESAIKIRNLSIFKRNIQQLEGLEYPLILDIYITYAQLAKKQRMYNDGITMLDNAELKHKKTKNTLLHKAGLYKKLNKDAEVIRVLNEALTLEPQSLDITHELASAYLNINTPKSISLFKQLLSSEHYKDAALSSLGLLYTRLYENDASKNRSNLVLALDYYNQYFQRHPKDQETRDIINNLRVLLD